MRALTMLYGLTCYALSMAALVAFILFANNFAGFIGMENLNIDTVNGTPAGSPLLVNLGLLLLFGLQHSVMARPGFKAAMTKVIPPTWERSTYLLGTALVTGAIVWHWQPMAGALWHVQDELLRTLINVVYFAGYGVVVAATFMLNHFHLFGLQQTFRAVDPDSGTKEFKTPGLYAIVRHPIQTGVVISMLATPDMTTGRLVLAVGMLVYIAIGLYYEEKDLLAHFGDTYRDYKNRVPGVIPFLKGSSRE